MRSPPLVVFILRQKIHLREAKQNGQKSNRNYYCKKIVTTIITVVILLGGS